MKYHRKPATVEAMRWTGANWDEAKAFVADLSEAVVSGVGDWLSIFAPDGKTEARPGYWLVRDGARLSAVSPDAFAASYELPGAP